ncbi:MAG: (d)CMP kinase [Chitinivibrionales bacterium]|nr:(d)CMP kinase [Chitinivibrionales bacterium]
MVIAIDGPAGSGKSTTAKLVASRLGMVHLDTGAMYRVITLACLRKNIKADDNAGLAKIVRETEISFSGTPPSTKIWMNGEDVSKEIRGDAVTKNVSDYCAPVVVREALVNQQRSLGGSQSVVCEGRDIGTVVFPKAEYKFFMVASVAARAARRQKDFNSLGQKKTLPELMAEIDERDRKDSGRALSPLRKADDAIEIDTTDLSIEQQVSFIIDTVERDRKK